MGDKLMSRAQGDAVTKMGVDKGVSLASFQEYGIRQGYASIFLDAVKRGSLVNMGIPVIELPEITICAIEVERNLSPRWEDVILEGCPDTMGGPQFNEYLAADGDTYLKLMKPLKAKQTLTLLRFNDENRGWGRAFVLAEQMSLEETDPRWIFSLAKNRPRLNRDLGLPMTSVVATSSITRKGDHTACAVWWDGSGAREAGTVHPNSFGSHYGWFAFQTQRP